MQVDRPHLRVSVRPRRGVHHRHRLHRVPEELLPQRQGQGLLPHDLPWHVTRVTLVTRDTNVTPCRPLPAAAAVGAGRGGGGDPVRVAAHRGGQPPLHPPRRDDGLAGDPQVGAVCRYFV